MHQIWIIDITGVIISSLSFRCSKYLDPLLMKWLKQTNFYFCLEFHHRVILRSYVQQKWKPSEKSKDLFELFSILGIYSFIQIMLFTKKKKIRKKMHDKSLEKDDLWLRRHQINYIIISNVKNKFHGFYMDMLPYVLTGCVLFWSLRKLRRVRERSSGAIYVNLCFLTMKEWGSHIFMKKHSQMSSKHWIKMRTQKIKKQWR